MFRFERGIEFERGFVRIGFDRGLIELGFSRVGLLRRRRNGLREDLSRFEKKKLGWDESR